MKTIGEQQNFQTLFCELRLENERLAPRFSGVWNTAQARSRPRVGFKFAFVATGALVVVSLLSLALVLGGRASNQQQESRVVNPPASPTNGPASGGLETTPKPIVTLRSNYRFASTRRAMKLGKLRRLKAPREYEFRDALAVSNWQSPTAMLMDSPADDVLMSVPQLYRSVNQLMSFLPETQK